MRILNVDPDRYSDKARAVLETLGRVDFQSLSRESLISELPKYDVLIVRFSHQIDRDIIDAGGRLKAIVSATTGLDHIDTDAAKERGIEIICLKGEIEFLSGIRATPEHCFALMLALLRKLHAAAYDAARERWDRDCFVGGEICGKRLGLVGLGRVGKRVAEYGLVFGAEISYFDPYVDSANPSIKRHATLDELLSSSDILSLHVPLSAETSGMIGRRELLRLPRDAYVINTSRGDVIDETSLVELLASGQIAGAALDVLMNEASLRRNPEPERPAIKFAFQHPDRLILTPHVAGATRESMHRTEEFVVGKLRDFMRARFPELLEAGSF